jgi:hypothetical protein
LALPASLPCINSLRVLANQSTNPSKSQHHGVSGEGGRGRQEGPRGGPEDGGVAAGGVRAAAGPAPASGRDRGGLRARHGVHVDRPAQEGGAPLQAGEQARELRRGGSVNRCGPIYRNSPIRRIQNRSELKSW